MKSNRSALSGVLLLCAVLAKPACAQMMEPSATDTAPKVAAAQVVAPTEVIRLPMNSPVEFEFVTQLNSRSNKIDEMFPIRLTAPIMADGRIVVPAGALGEGQVVHAAKAGWGGKAGELTVTVRYVEYGGVRIPLRRFRMGEIGIGKDRKDEAFAASVIISPVLGFVINGGEKTILPGTRANAIVSADTEVPAPPPEPVVAADAPLSN